MPTGSKEAPHGDNSRKTIPLTVVLEDGTKKSPSVTIDYGSRPRLTVADGDGRAVFITGGYHDFDRDNKERPISGIPLDRLVSARDDIDDMTEKFDDEKAEIEDLKDDNDRDKEARLKSVADRIFKAADHYIKDRGISLPDDGINWDVLYENASSELDMNAATVAGGKVIVSDTLMDEITPTDDDLAIILGHEAAHEILHHTYTTADTGERRQTVENYFKEGGNSNLERLRALPPSSRSVLAERNADREKEVAADRLGVYLARIAGYDVSHADDVWKRYAALDHEHSSPNDKPLLSDHPQDSARIGIVLDAAGRTPGAGKYGTRVLDDKTLDRIVGSLEKLYGKSIVSLKSATVPDGTIRAANPCLFRGTLDVYDPIADIGNAPKGAYHDSYILSLFGSEDSMRCEISNGFKTVKSFRTSMDSLDSDLKKEIGKISKDGSHWLLYTNAGQERWNNIVASDYLMGNADFFEGEHLQKNVVPLDDGKFISGYIINNITGEALYKVNNPKEGTGDVYYQHGPDEEPSRLTWREGNRPLWDIIKEGSLVNLDKLYSVERDRLDIEDSRTNLAEEAGDKLRQIFKERSTMTSKQLSDLRNTVECSLYNLCDSIGGKSQRNTDNESLRDAARQTASEMQSQGITIYSVDADDQQQNREETRGMGM